MAFYRNNYKSIVRSIHYLLSPAVKNALENNKPVVALESTIITHGMPFPNNLKTALDVEKIVESQGCVPATIAVLDGAVS